MVYHVTHFKDSLVCEANLAQNDKCDECGQYYGPGNPCKCGKQ